MESNIVVKNLIGKNMKEIRNAKGLSQQQVAEKLNMERSVYTKFETGQNKPSIEQVKKFAEIFKIDIKILERNVSVVIPDTSALLKNRRLLSILLEDYGQVIIPNTVLNELDYQKDRGKIKKRLGRF